MCLPHTDNNSSPEEVKVLIEEIDLMSDLGIHPNVVNVLAVCTVGDPVYLIMDYFAHGDLLGFLRATRGHTDHYTVSAGTETRTPACTAQSQDLLNLATQIANGMSFLEEKKVSHRSLCARNVLVGTGLQVKIYNYGQKNDDQVCVCVFVHARLYGWMYIQYLLLFVFYRALMQSGWHQRHYLMAQQTQPVMYGHLE